jgi:superfamily II DNA or RNA helicase
MTLKPHAYQRKAINAALIGLRSSHKRALVVMATGLGKTLTAAFITRVFVAKRILFLAHSNHILLNSMVEFERIFGGKMTMAIYNGMRKKGAQEADIVFATWQTMGGHLNEWTKPYFDLIIVDEAHHTEADTYRPTVDHFIGAKLGITATPDRTDEKDIREVFGPAVITILLEEAIARGWLPRIEYHVITDKSLDDGALQEIAAEIRAGHRGFTMAEVNRRIFIKKRDQEIAAIINGYEEKALVFCQSITHAERMSESLKLACTFHSKKGLTQKDTWDKNQAVLADLKNGVVRRICAVNAFNEGMNVPTVGLVAFCRVTDILTIFYQQLGRGLRPGKDKLIVLDFVGNLERIKLVLAMMNKISDLHEEYTPREEIQREGYVRERFEVFGKGFKFTFSDEVVDLMKVLKHCERKFYPTWQEASEAAIKLGLTTQDEYIEGFRADPRLPSNVWTVYPDYPGDTLFFGREKRVLYDTLEKAMRAARELGAKSVEEYVKLRVKDPMLPRGPDGVYPDFPGWNKFLGTEKYSTWREASEAVAKLGIKSWSEYRRRYKEDVCLPASPNLYRRYPGAENFFGIRRRPYETWQQASRVAIKLGITTRNMYLKIRKEDQLLPADPSVFYRNFPDWGIFLKTGRQHRSMTYGTWQQASKAARKMGIQSKEQYAMVYKKDDLLPSSPLSRYGQHFPGWSVFLGKV